MRSRAGAELVVREAMFTAPRSTLALLGTLVTIAGCGGDGGGGETTCASAGCSDDSGGTGGPTTGTGGEGTGGSTSSSSSSGGEAGDSSTSSVESTGSPTSSTGGGDPTMSAGCGKPPLHMAGGVQVEIDAGPAGDGMRGFFLSLPANYDPTQAHRLILGYPGTNWVGEQIQPYLGLEEGAQGDEIFVYPDPLWRDFPDWGNLGGWVLGPNAYPADGDQDLVFTGAILDYMAAEYCIDTDRVFATGHSWGGDMAMVVSCFLGDRFRASVPVAANRPYWFEEDGGWSKCSGDTAVWTMFGAGDDHFTWQDYDGQFGDECRDFWVAERGCAGVDQAVDLGLGASMECVEYAGCAQPTRYCLYDAQFGHQRPDYFPAASMAFFRSF